MAQSGLSEIASHLAIETRAVTLEGRRARLGLAAACAVPLAVLIALAASVDYPFWAGLYCWLVLKPAAGATIRDAIRRMLATLLGAWLGYVLAAGFAAFHVLTHVALFLVVAVCVYRQMTSRHPVFWLVTALTMVIVTFDSLTTPQLAITVAASRCLEIMIGVSVGSFVGLLLLPDEPLTDPIGSLAPADALFTALVAGFAITLMPALWFPLELQSLSAAGFASLLIPAPQEGVERFKALNILVGIAIGGGLGLIAARLAAGALVPWFGLMVAAIFAFAQVHLSGGRVALAGTFMGVGFLIANVQGPAPTTDTSPPIWFMASAAAGALIVLAMSRILSLVRPQEVRPPPQRER
jgi:Fusaric acid resistance protein family